MGNNWEGFDPAGWGSSQDDAVEAWDQQAGAVRHPGACVFVLLDCELSLLAKITETPRNTLQF